MAARSHTSITIRLVATTVLIFAALSAGLLACARLEATPAIEALAMAPLVILQGLWLYRLYVVAHEGVHKKLFPNSPFLNDLAGTLLLLPIAAPFSVYRKIHYFHHGSNRKDDRHAALDQFHVGAVGPAGRAYYRAVWFFYVFCGGFYLHSLATILIFLLLPMTLARRINVLFTHWKSVARLRAWLEFAAGLAFHAAIWKIFGFAGWAAMLGAPILFFGWIWSIFLYIYHYDTTLGPEVKHNVRSLPAHPFFSRLLLNFNEHVTHHDDPSVPWYELPARRKTLPPGFEHNQKVNTLWGAVVQQINGPVMR